MSTTPPSGAGKPAPPAADKRRQPIAFTAPLGDRHVLWVSSPAGWFMLLEGSWAFEETARLFAERCGYEMITTKVGIELVERQMAERGITGKRERERIVH